MSAVEALDGEIIDMADDKDNIAFGIEKSDGTLLGGEWRR